MSTSDSAPSPSPREQTLARLMQHEPLGFGLDIIAFNGEDYYNAAGQVTYLADPNVDLEKIRLAVNIDGAGYRQGKNAYSLYECPHNLEALIHQVCRAGSQMIAGPQWFQGDHMIFVMQNIPALAFTSEAIRHVSTVITHTPDDQPALVDCTRLTAIALTLKELLVRLDEAWL